ncbi:response regulator transcription factor [Anoxybacterium hadale]|uniref:response regulator transcription factor n=1 Tax=Anoxybacterium hadale TaxID=3408580 RepID=UPI003B00BE0F
MNSRIKILYVEDDLDFIYIIGKMLEKEPDFEICGYARTREEGIALAKELQPDIALVDLSLTPNNFDGIDAAKEIHLVCGAKIVLLTSFEQPKISIEASKRSFASGYVFKSQCQLLPETIRKTAAGATPQEQFIKALIIDELSNAEKSVLLYLLGEELKIASSEKTIANQKTNIFRKLGVRNTDELIRLLR